MLIFSQTGFLCNLKSVNNEVYTSISLAPCVRHSAHIQAHRAQALWNTVYGALMFHHNVMGP